MKKVMILTGAGQIGMAIARRTGTGMNIVIGDKIPENAEKVSKTMNEAGFDTIGMEMDLCSRESIRSLIEEAKTYGDITMLVNAAGVSPSQAPVESILKADLYGTAVLLEEVGKVIAPRRRWRDHFQPVGTPDAGAGSGGGRAAGVYSHGKAPGASASPAGKHPGYASCLSAGKKVQ